MGLIDMSCGIKNEDSQNRYQEGYEAGYRDGCATAIRILSNIKESEARQMAEKIVGERFPKSDNHR